MQPAHHPWSADSLPDLTTSTILVTGANSGIGFETARVLAGKGALVIMGCRNPERAREAAGRIRDEHPAARLTFVEIDLADLASVRNASQDIHRLTDRLDVLINNAGIMLVPKTGTKEGFELMIGTNHLGPFALTGLLIDLLLAAPSARIIQVTSLAHYLVRIRPERFLYDPRRHAPAFIAYGQSKLANLLFTFELQRRLAAGGYPAAAAAAHPGIAETRLTARFGSPFYDIVVGPLLAAVSQKPESGALSILYAAAREIRGIGGACFGPDGLFQWRGNPCRVRTSRRALDVSAADRLWQISERLTGVVYPLSSG